ncbi:hypothetical protein F5Y03DRAFT_347229 [Xylaria venustula]|nr:hypothetical protein F5Y03DRAFT_347229 [Xylaria venustula]
MLLRLVSNAAETPPPWTGTCHLTRFRRRLDATPTRSRTGVDVDQQLCCSTTCPCFLWVLVAVSFWQTTCWKPVAALSRPRLPSAQALHSQTRRNLLGRGAEGQARADQGLQRPPAFW